MKPTLANNSIRAICADCETLATFDYRDPEREFGYISIRGIHDFDGGRWEIVIYRLLRCSGCHKGAVAKIHQNGQAQVLESFYPSAIERLPLPTGISDGVVREFREAELCASIGANRGALALLRSCLEKVLKENGYTQGTLKDKINEAAQDHIITATRQKGAHDKVRDLSNDILHEPWREISDEEVESARRYTQRILEDFYDDRAVVEEHLRSLGKLRESSSEVPTKV